MIGDEMYSIWMRSEADMEQSGPQWGRWAKPVLFAAMDTSFPTASGDAQARQDVAAWPPLPEGATRSDWLPDPDSQQAVIVDIAGDEAVEMGLKLAQRGYWPVPLFNACPAPAGSGTAVVDVQPIIRTLIRCGGVLRSVRTQAKAPPAFLLDSRRLGKGGRGAPGDFDNRSIVLPQDFPSASYLKTWDISRILLVQVGRRQPKDDLAHVLRRWQEDGLQILSKDLLNGAAPTPLTVSRPSGFRSLWYVALTMLGFRRNSAGGFGSQVPIAYQSSGGGFHGGGFYGGIG